MAYYIIKNYSKSGQIGISDKVFEEITQLVIDEFPELKIHKVTNRIIYKQKPISIIRNSNNLKINIQVKVVNCENATEICQDAQERIKQTILTMTELEPAQVNIKVINN